MLAPALPAARGGAADKDVAVAVAVAAEASAGVDDGAVDELGAAGAADVLGAGT